MNFLLDSYYTSLYWSIPILIFFILLFFSEKNSLFLKISKWMIVPITIIIGSFAIYHDYMSYFKPIERFPPKEIEYVYNMHKVDWKEKEMIIVLWVTENDSNREFLYVFPYSEEIKKKLDELQKESKGSNVQFDYEGSGDFKRNDRELNIGDFSFILKPRTANPVPK